MKFFIKVKTIDVGVKKKKKKKAATVPVMAGHFVTT